MCVDSKKRWCDRILLIKKMEFRARHFHVANGIHFCIHAVILKEFGDTSTKCVFAVSYSN